MPLPNVSALSLHAVPPTGPSGEPAATNPLVDMQEDPDTLHFNFITPNIDFENVYPTDRFYHQTFCPDISRYATAFACHTKFARAFAAPTDDVFEWLYDEFNKRDMIDTRYVRYEIDPAETAFAFFARACRAATADREKLKRLLRSIAFDKKTQRHYHWRPVHETRQEIAALAEPCDADRALIFEIIANKENKFLDMNEFMSRNYEPGILARLSFYAFIDVDLMEDLKFVTDLWASKSHKIVAPRRTSSLEFGRWDEHPDGMGEHLSYENFVFDNLTMLAPSGVFSFSLASNVAIRLVERDPNLIFVALDPVQSPKFRATCSNVYGRLAKAAVKGDPSLYDGLVYLKTNEMENDLELLLMNRLEWEGVALQARASAISKVTADAEAINDIGTELLVGNEAIPERLLKANPGAFKALSKVKLTAQMNAVMGERAWVKLIMTYLTRFPERVDELSFADKRNQDLVMSIMVALPETVPFAEQHLRQYFEATAWADMLPLVFSSDEDSDAAAGDQQQEDEDSD